MVGKIRKCICILTAAAVLLGGIQAPVSAEAQGTKLQAGTEGLSQREGVTVTTREEFMEALAQNKSPITVTNLIVIGKDADTDNRMLPVMIPANTLIQGTGNGAICSRSPIQLEGDGVCFQNIELIFESSTALGSVPHREIFLAGHSLTLDNVNTYLEGAPELGGFGGSEKELLPTVYAGGYSGKQIGANASLTVRNSNDETMFQAIYMGHAQGSDNKVPYRGTAVLNLDAKAIVREDVNTVLNSQAEINITGGENQAAGAKEFYGNEKTTLTLSQVSMEGAVVERIGNIVLKDKASLAPVTQLLQNVSLFHGACLDFNDVENPVISGDFSGEADPNGERGILVLNPEGLLTILGNVTGTTQFQTGHRLFPGVLFRGKSYIFAQAGKEEEPGFVLAPQKIEEGYDLTYENGGWKISGEPVTFREIGRIEFLSVPTKADLRKIAQKEDGSIPDENTYFEIKWYDQNQQEFTAEEVSEEYGFYDINYVVKIRTDYWESDSDEILDQTDWFQDVFLVEFPDQPGRYYLEAYSQAVPGDYTFLFCSEYLESDLTTVADVKALKDLVKAEKRVIFYDQDQEEPDHMHKFQSSVTKQPSCTEAGEKVFRCECGEYYAEKIDASGHQEVIDPAVAPTETEPGKTAGSHCSVCNEVLKEQVVIPATGTPQEPELPGHTHVYQSTVTREPYCTEPGENTFACECGEKYTEEIAALGHKPVTDPAVEPTETEPGKTEGSHCEVCGEIIKAQETIPAAGSPEHVHTYESIVTKAPTCAEAGVRTNTCKCGEEYTEEIAALGHKPVTDPAVEPTETEPGKTEGSHCSVCNEILKVQETIPATGVPEHVHAYESIVTKAPTCTEAGVRTNTCKCGEKYTEEIAALGHKPVTDPAVEPTETEPGKTEGSHCSVCNEILKAQETIPATGIPEHVHAYESVVTKAPTCTEAGVRTNTCKCGEKYTEEIAALGHKPVTDPAVEPTETEPGKTEGSHCSVCNEILKAQEIIPAAGTPEDPIHVHKYQCVITEPTCARTGIKTYTCNCGDTYTEEINVLLRHQYVDKCIPATVKSSGLLQQVCSVCSDTKLGSVIDSPQKIRLNKTEFTYDGKVKKPSVTVKDSKGRSLKAGTDYQIISAKGGKNPGVYTIAVEFRGKYSGRLTENFTIRPKKTSLKKTAAKSRGIQVTWNRQTAQIDGYQIQCCTSGNFKGKTLKSVTAKKSAAVKKISGLKGKKKYYVRIRTYKTVKVNGKKQKLYSGWSGRKTVRTKK